MHPLEYRLTPYITRNKTCLLVRVPGCRAESFNLTAIHAAIDYRDALCRAQGIPHTSFTTLRHHNKNHVDKLHSDLPVGISRYTQKYKCKDGTIKTSYGLTACAAGKTKSAAVGRLRNEEEACAMLVEWRRIQIRNHFKGL